MKMNNFTKAVAVLAIAGIVGFAATSFAGWGKGGGYCGGQSSGWGQRGVAPSGYQGNLSEDQITLKKRVHDNAETVIRPAVEEWDEK